MESSTLARHSPSFPIGPFVTDRVMVEHKYRRWNMPCFKREKAVVLLGVVVESHTTSRRVTACRKPPCRRATVMGSSNLEKYIRCVVFTDLSVSLPVYLWVCTSVSLSVCQSTLSLSVCLWLFDGIKPRSVCLSVSQSFSKSVSQSVSLSVCLSIPISRPWWQLLKGLGFSTATVVDYSEYPPVAITTNSVTGLLRSISVAWDKLVLRVST